MTYHENIIHGITSDIFKLHNLNKAKIKPQHVKRTSLITPLTSSPVKPSTLFQTLSSKTQSPKNAIITLSTPQYSLINQRQPGRKYLAKNILVLVKEDDFTYRVKRSKNSSRNPNKYYKNPTAYERKIQQLYGNNSKYIEEGNHKLKASLGRLEAEIRLVDNKTSSGSVKDKIYYMLYHTNGAPKNNWTSLAASYNKNSHNNKKAFRNSVDGQCIERKDDRYNHVESLKSNISFSFEMEKRNKELFDFSKSKCIEPSEDNAGEHYHKKNRRLNQDELIYAKADWKDPKSHLHFRNRSETKTARNRKLNNLLGSKEFTASYQTSSVVMERDMESDLHMREAFESKYDTQHPVELESKVKKHDERISTIQNENNQHLYKPIKVNINSDKAERMSHNYEVKNFANVKDVNFEQIEKGFKDKGMHDGRTVGKLVFFISDITNGNDRQFRSKFNEAKEANRKETRLDIKNTEIDSIQKKAIASTVLAILTWDYDKVYNYVRGRD